MTDNKGIGSKFTPGATPPITAQPLPAQPASAAPDPAAAATPAPNPTGSTSAASPSTPPPAPGAHGRRRPRRPAANPHTTPATPAAPLAPPAPAAPAPADSDDEPEGSPDTENVVKMTEAEWRKKLEEEKAEEAKNKEDKKLKNRIKRAPKAFGSWLKAWARKHWFVTTVLVVALIASLTMWVNGKISDENTAAPEPTYSAPKGIMPGGDEGSQRGSKADNAPTVKDNGDTKVFEYTDPNFKAVTFKVITDEDLNISEVKLGEKLKEYGGKLSIGTVDDSQESDVRCSRNAQVCDFSAEKISICKSWLSLTRIIPVQGGSDQQQPFWTALEVYNATPVGTYSGSTDLPHFCRVEDSDTSS